MERRQPLDASPIHLALRNAFPKTASPIDSIPLQQGSVIMHIAWQGCLRAGPIRYGLTADTGGHIRYLLELVEALAERPEVHHQIIVTRAFDAPHLGEEYARTEERLGERVTLWRCWGKSRDYLPKEELWRELPSLANSLLGRLDGHELQPDLVHAHYSDAGVVALKLKATLGVPYVFTSHSLGATKARHRSLDPGTTKPLRRRIRYEELAIRGADRLITSSEHEAEFQCGLYRNHDAGKTLVNPPGCAVPLFSVPAPASHRRQVDTQLRRFLHRPDRPCLLALARPVEKKNLYALVRAYGEHAGLREQANLVIFAGSSRQWEDAEPEARQVWLGLLELIDHYDLYGCVAYPKHHHLDHVPAIYQWAADRQGVFVNPALNEPFGLTLLEAAAAGLPVVATREGGPVDIVGRCQNGHLVEPTDHQGLAVACHELLTDTSHWQQCSRQGRCNVSFYTWQRHASQYVRELSLGHGAHEPVQAPRPVSHLLATDMDGTLLGDSKGLDRLSDWLDQHPDWLFVLATGRSLHEALDQLAAWSAPLPDFIVADVGSSLYQLDDRGHPRPVGEWQHCLARQWNRAACQRVLSCEPLLIPQPASTQSPYKLSYFARVTQPGESGLDSERTQGLIEGRLAAAGLKARVVVSHGNLVDVLPPDGGKSGAVEFIRQHLAIREEEVLGAGDSGNDTDLLEHCARAIVVANHTSELRQLDGRSTVYWARSAHAGGILEGLDFWTSHSQTATTAKKSVPTARSDNSPYPTSSVTVSRVPRSPRDIEAGA